MEQGIARPPSTSVVGPQRAFAARGDVRSPGGMTHCTTNPSFAIARTAPNEPALWAIDSVASINAEPLPVDDLERRAAIAIKSADTSGLLMVLAEAVEFGHHRIAGSVARASLDKNMQELPGVSAERLHAMAIAGGIAVDVATVSDLAVVAEQLRNSAVMHEIGFGLTSSRANPTTVAASLAGAGARAERLASALDRIGAGKPTKLVPAVRALSFFGLLSIARGLARTTTFDSGTSALNVSVAAQIRHRVGAARGLRAQLEILEHDPGNTAARNSACACLVDLGMAEAGLDHLAVSLLRPDHYVGNTGRRALREAGYPGLAQLANHISVLMRDRYPEDPPHEVVRHAANILAGIRRRTQTELAMLNLVGKLAPERVFAGRTKVDDETAGAVR